MSFRQRRHVVDISKASLNDSVDKRKIFCKISDGELSLIHKKELDISEKITNTFLFHRIRKYVKIHIF